MKWKDRPESENVEDQRSIVRTGLVVGGGGAILLFLAVLVGQYFGLDLRPLLNQIQQQGGGNADQGGEVDPAQEELAKFAKVILHDTEDVWIEQFPKVYGHKYREPILRLFSRQVDTGCGLADSGVGPFYCPADERVYLDVTFFGELKKLMRVRSNQQIEFAQAYVIAHEVGHHVQKLLGYSEKVRTRKGELSDSVRLELQADYLAGVWAHYAQEKKKILEPGDIEIALTAAKSIGDDALQKRATGHVVPDSFTHGSSNQRIHAFTSGFETGDFSQRRLDHFFISNDPDDL